MFAGEDFLYLGPYGSPESKLRYERAVAEWLARGRLPPCAQAMLRNGVDGYQRVACFRLAVHLKLAGIPQELAVTLLRTWFNRNHPSAKQIITMPEINRQVNRRRAPGRIPYGSAGQ